MCVDLLKGLDRSRWRGIAVIPNQGWLHDRLTEHGIETYVLREKRSFDIPFLARVVGIIRRHRVDVLHGHLFGSSVRAALLSRITGTRSVGTLHGMFDLASAERHRALKFGILRSGLDRLVFVSDSLRRAFQPVLPFRPDRMRVIPNGLDAKRFSVPRDPAFRASLGIGQDEFVVGSVGNLNAAKGFDVLLRAAALLKKRASGYRFVVVGDTQGRQTAELTALTAQLGLSSDVIFTGFRSDIPRVLASFDAYALTSRSEGFSISVAEAMASSLPVVATRCGGPEEIVTDGESGILVENGSSEAVAEAIAWLRNEAKAARALGQAARKVVQARFDVTAQVRAYEQLYEETLSRRRSESRALHRSRLLI